MMRWGAYLVILLLTSCVDDLPDPPLPEPSEVRAVDASLLPLIRSRGVDFKDANGRSADFLDIVQDNGINTVRLRLWVNPTDESSSFAEVKTFGEEIRSKGLKLWLTVHYSDTWADPGHQEVPLSWSSSDLDQLADSVEAYTYRVVAEIEPDIVQIGNEINNGFLHPLGNRWNNAAGFHTLLNAGVNGARNADPDVSVMLHYAGYRGVEVFLQEVDSLDFDQVGLSYYPIWHGKSLDSLSAALTSISAYGKICSIAECAYPFTFDWADWTNNIIGSADQILPEFNADLIGQAEYIETLVNLVRAADGSGICYWGAELVAFDGPESTEGSPWENQALFDFNSQAVPALKSFD